MLKSYKGRRILAASSISVFSLSLLCSRFYVKGRRFRPFRFKFRPKRSDFGRKKLRTAETGVGFRLSEVVLSPGRRGGKLGGLQQALRRTPVFYPYRADSQSRPFGRGVALVAGDLPPSQRPTHFSQPPATLLPANRGGQADSPMARPARRSAAPRQQHQPGLRAAASSSAEHGQFSHRIFLHRPGHTV